MSLGGHGRGMVFVVPPPGCFAGPAGIGLPGGSFGTGAEFITWPADYDHPQSPPAAAQAKREALRGPRSSDLPHTPRREGWTERSSPAIHPRAPRSAPTRPRAALERVLPRANAAPA